MTTRIASITALLTVLIATPAGASCLPSTERDRVKRADAVFVGRVLSVSNRDGQATFRVIRVVKGAAGIRKGLAVRVRPTPYPSSVTINWTPRRGQRWRVYVDRTGGRWTTSDCHGTRRA